MDLPLKPSFQLIAGFACVLLIGGCELFGAGRDDAGRVTSGQAAASARPTPAARPPRPPNPKSSADMARATVEATPDARPMALSGKSDSEIRALFGAPSAEEDRAPGRTWRYRDGRCTMEIQLYPDVQTRKYGTLAYEVKSDDDSDEGRRRCAAQFRSRAQARGG